MHERSGWGLRVAALVSVTSALGCEALDSNDCSSQSDCAADEQCGARECFGRRRCVPRGCDCNAFDGSIAATCPLLKIPSCNCDSATCQHPLNSCGTFACPGVCSLGESCQHCLGTDVCSATQVCAESACIVDGAGQAKCRPLECGDPFRDPPLCGSSDSACGVCPTPDCEGRECGEAANSSASCGTCPVHWDCRLSKCYQDARYTLCEGDLEVMPEEVPSVAANSPLPQPQGGVIEDGIYDLVEERVSSLAAEKYSRAALRFSDQATHAEHIYDAVIGSQTDDQSPHRLMSVSVDGTMLQFHVDCPERSYVLFPDYMRGFTVTGDQLLLFQPNMVEVYVRRP